MAKQNHIVIVDRSELAGNIYKLLLAELGASLVIRKRFAEALPNFTGRRLPKLAIFNSNTFGKKFGEIISHMEEDNTLKQTHKIFLCRENQTEEAWGRALARLPRSHVMVRPFHPDEFGTLVRKLIA